MQKSLILLLLFLFIQLSAQPKLTLIFEKEKEISDPKNPVESYKEIYYLNLTETVSEYFMAKDTVVDGKIQHVPTHFLYKNLETNTYTEQTGKGEFTHGKLPQYDWVLKAESKKILGYIVKKATLNLGSETQITAWYSNLTYQNGPENYHRLPGLILEIEITKNINGQSLRTKFTAISMDISKNSKTISPPDQQ